MLRAVKWLLLAFAVAFFATSSFAQTSGTVVICTEDPVSGCVANIPTAVPILVAASDGEATFDPFGAGFDTSDGIQLTASWVPDNSNGAFDPGFWQVIPGTNTWVLPSVTPCGAENEPACEPVAKWDFLTGAVPPGGGWGPQTPNFVLMLEADGSIGDIITLANDGPGNTATISFASDPSLPTPEPTTLSLIGLGGLLRLAAGLRKKFA